MGDRPNLDSGNLVFTADDSDEDLNEEEDEFHFASDQLPPQPQPTRRAPSSSFQFTINPEPSQNIPAQPQPPVQPILPFLQRQHAPAPVQPRPEFIEIHKTPTQLTADCYLSKENITLWNNFFSTKNLNPEENFVERRQYLEARKKLWLDGYCTITGHCGDGKSCLAEHIMISFVVKPGLLKNSLSNNSNSSMKDNYINEKDRPLYECVYVNSPEEWYMKVHSDKKQIVIIDDIFGVASTSFHKIEPWIPHLEKIVDTVKTNLRNTLLIVTLHKHQYDKLPLYIRKKRLFRKESLVDLVTTKESSWDNSTIMEKTCENYDMKLDWKDRESLQYDKVIEGYAIKYRLFAAVKSFHMEGRAYFTNTEREFENVIQKVYSFDKISFYTLAVAVLFDGKLDLDKEVFEQYSDREQKIFKELIEPLNVPPDVNLGKMRYAATLLNGAFFSPRQLHCWVFCHEYVMHLVAESINRKIPKKIVELCSYDFLMERLRTGNYYGSKMESSLTVWQKEHSELAQRLTYEILSGNVRPVASHPALNNENFCKDFFVFMEEMGSLLPVAQQKGPHNRSLFFWAAYYGQEATVKQYLTNEELKDLREQQWFQEELAPALFAACCANTIAAGRMVKLLLESGAPIDSVDNLDEEDLLELYGDDVVDLLKLNPTLMHIAAQFALGDTIKALKEKGLDIEAELPDGYRPLHLAVRNLDESAARVLMDMKCELDAATPTGHTPMHEAFLCGHDSLIRSLHYSGRDRLRNLKMPSNVSTLFAAACLGKKETVSSVALTTNDYRGNSVFDPWPPLAEAAAQGDLETVRYLVENNKADINQSGLSGWTALHLAIVFYQDEVVTFLLSKGADVHCKTSNKLTPLHLAAEGGYVDIIHELLQKGALPEARTSQGEFPITLAAKGGHANLIEYFVEEGIELPLPQERVVTDSQRDEIISALLACADKQGRHRFMWF